MLWQCNSCGQKMNEPDICPHCNNRICSKCKSANALMNVSEWERMVSHAVPDKRSNMKRVRSSSNKTKKPKDPAKKIAALMANLEIRE